MKKTILTNATLLPEYGFAGKKVNVTIEDGVISAITETLPDAKGAETVDCGGNLLIPAFYNAHCHAAMTLFRGYGEDLPLQRWLEERIYPAEDRLTDKSVYLATKMAIAEMLANGVASFSDMYFFMDNVAEAVIETGIKANLSRSVVSFDPAYKMEDDVRMREAIELADRYHNAADGRIKVDFAIHAEYSNVPAACDQIGAYVKERGLRFQIHLSETEKEQKECIARHGKTPSEFFLEHGVFDSPTTAAHCVWVSDSDIEILRDKHVFVAHNPVSNLKLGSGVMPLRKLLDAGVTVALGTDGTASNNRLDVLREMQTAAILHKGVNCDPVTTVAREMLPLATRNGALSQGRDDCGDLKVGFRADLTLIDRNSVHNIPCYDDHVLLSYSADTRDVRMTMVDGRILYRNGEYTSIDEERLRYDFRETVAHYFD